MSSRYCAIPASQRAPQARHASNRGGANESRATAVAWNVVARTDDEMRRRRNRVCRGLKRHGGAMHFRKSGAAPYSIAEKRQPEARAFQRSREQGVDRFGRDTCREATTERRTKSSSICHAAGTMSR